jgi:ribosomal-protein-alanine N-acetyltransferase
LRGEQVYLRAPQPGDWAEWARVRAASREFLTPWEPTWAEDELTRNAFRRRLRRYARDAREGFGYAFFVFHRQDDRLLGGVTLSNVRRGVTQSCSLGYWMGKPHAGKGLMQDAVRTVLGFVFENLGLHRLEAACLPNNEASKTVLRKVGFEEEGYARQYLRINGRWSDHLLFAMLHGDRDKRG